LRDQSNGDLIHVRVIAAAVPPSADAKESDHMEPSPHEL
jgi:hypothetical protein